MEIFGPEASGKTTLALHLIAEAQKQGGEAIFYSHRVRSIHQLCICRSYFVYKDQIISELSINYILNQSE